MGFGLVVSVTTVFFTPSGKNTKTQIKPFGYYFGKIITHLGIQFRQ